MRCPNCGNENPNDYTFCDECGAKLTPTEGDAAAPGADTATSAPANIEDAAALDALADAVASAPTSVATATATAETVTTAATCPNCGSVTVPGEAFCNECGAELATAVAAMPADAPVAEPVEAATSVPVAEEAMAEGEPGVPMPGDAPVEAAPMPAVPVGEVASDEAMPAPPVEAPMPASLPAPPVVAVGGTAAVWATEALRQLDEAQQAMTKGDWVAYGENMSTLKSYLESVAGGTVSESAGRHASAAAAAMAAAAVAGESAAAVATPAVSAAPVAASSGGSGMARLVVIATGAEMPLPQQEEITVGREDPSSGIFPDVDLTPYGGEDGGVSRRHARLLHISGDYFVEDLQSTNYTKLDGQRLPARVREKLEDGARLDFGRVAMIFRKG